MTIKLGIVMDPIENIKVQKDTSFALLLESQRRGWENYYIEPQNIFLKDNHISAEISKISVEDNKEQWYAKEARYNNFDLRQCDVILMRKDPPFDLEYIYLTYLLELLEKDNVLIVNKPRSLRDANEKLFASWFPHCIPETLVSSHYNQLKEFTLAQKEVIFKPLNGMGGMSIFQVSDGDPNINVIIELMTNKGKTPIMAQRYLPEIEQGDKRILIINGKPYPKLLARIPAEGESRGNLAAGGIGEGRALTERDQWLCSQIAPKLLDMGLWFVGLDVIGDYVTEINVTSPTCVRELDGIFNINVSAVLLDAIEENLKRTKG